MSQVAIAKAIAIAAHKGQSDKAGVEYITHPERVAAYVAESGGDTLAVAAAWLHDVLEDSTVESSDLRAAGVEYDVIATVERVTRAGHAHDDHYYARIRGSERATQVKLADIRDNTDPRRLALLEEPTQVRLLRKYAKALHAIHGTKPVSS